jgi:predicted RNA-binding Zn-ribbon protein involved in translation (DUF1610 family)
VEPTYQWGVAMQENRTVCPGCGTKIRVAPYSVLEGFHAGAATPIRRILADVPDEDGTVLTIAQPNGIVNCPTCGTAIARLVTNS